MWKQIRNIGYKELKINVFKFSYRRRKKIFYGTNHYLLYAIWLIQAMMIISFHTKSVFVCLELVEVKLFLLLHIFV